jgi:hypothetical protein
LTWQRPAPCLSGALQRFLSGKDGIVPANYGQDGVVTLPLGEELAL